MASGAAQLARTRVGPHGGGPGRAVSDSTFLVIANGHRDSPPAGPFLEHLLALGARRVIAVTHPLTAEGDPRHEIAVWERGAALRTRHVRLPSRPPYTYPLDVLVPPWPEQVDGWFAFNNLACARGLLARRLGRAGRAVYWAVDFVPDRFGSGLMTRAYDAIDRLCCLHADARFDLSRAALEGRSERHALRPGEGAATRVVPIGAWLDRVPSAPEDGWRARRVVFLGHLVPRQGVTVLLEALAELRRREVSFEAEIAGRGPLERELRNRSAELGLAELVRFRGFLADHTQVEAFLAAGSVAVAPYEPSEESFTRFADPSKLKSYLAAGLPILTTDVPPNAHELAARGGAEVVPYDALGMADALERALSSPESWARRRAQALALAREFDWPAILDGALEASGFAPR
jgi:glycosyltransferase involved in cell wall biosynthesis